ncbi:MAG TPA: DUF2848 domain-containing protein [Steroidobacteraceae bacterium]|nr:DUF2848 domain-containing protein [Steroidobacteraceae bacterium]
MHCSSGETKIAATATELIIAGWTGRDRAAVEAHIEELAALGVPRPRRVPVFYRLASSLLAQDDAIEVVGSACSGEAEAVVMRFGGELWVGLGSDHTDRKLESISVSVAKQVCAKPLARAVWPLSEASDHWDRLILRSYILTTGGRELYQEGELGANLSALELIRQYAGGAGLREGAVMFCGTLPVRGSFRSGARFELELEDPVRRRSLRHSYGIQQLAETQEFSMLNGMDE